MVNMKKRKITKKYLVEQYIKNKKNSIQIAKSIKCCDTTIRNYLKKYNIKIRTLSEVHRGLKHTFKTRQEMSISHKGLKHTEATKIKLSLFHKIYDKILTKQFLIKEYIKNNKSTLKIAKKIDCSVTTIWKFLKKYNIPVRNFRESSCWKGKKNPEQSKRMKGKKHPNYIEGLDRKYPLEFDNQLKQQIRKRDDYTCQNCNMTEEEHIIVHGRVLDVHHIDYDKDNLAPENLISLCQSCNIRANYNRKYWIEYFQTKTKEKV